MEHARKMALVDPRLLDTLRSPPPPPVTDTLGKKVQALDDDMKTILDRKDLDDGTKVTLCCRCCRCCSGTTSWPINTSRNRYAWSR